MKAFIFWKNKGLFININYARIPTASSAKYLGVTLDTVQKARHILRRQSKTPNRLKRLIYKAYIRQTWNFACAIWNSASNTHLHKLDTSENNTEKWK